MSTALVLSNQKYLVNIDHKSEVKDLFFPHIGLENQLNKFRNHSCVWIDGVIYNFSDDNVEVVINYDDFSATGYSVVKIASEQVEIGFKYFMLTDLNIFYRKFCITNNSDEEKTIKIFFQNNYALRESLYADTAVWYQPVGALLHYKKDRYLAIVSQDKFYQFSCAAKSDFNDKGAIPDSNGELNYNVVATGNVNSCVSFKFTIAAGQKATSDLGIAVATSLAEVEKLVKIYRERNIDEAYDEVRNVWRNMLIKEAEAIKVSNRTNNELTEKIQRYYYNSIIQVLSQIDRDGCIVAASDGQYIKKDGVDTYSYYWPRDGANVILALNKLKQQAIAKKALKFSLRMTESRGYFLHKYLPTTELMRPALGSSWHGWIDQEGREILPIQEDATALNLIAIVDYFNTFNDKAFLIRNWNYIEAIIKFLKSFNYKRYKSRTNIGQYVSGFDFGKNENFVSKSYLPYPSFDIWEQYYGIFTHTSILVLEAIGKAAIIAKEMNAIYLEQDLNAFYSNLKNDILKYLVNQEDGMFIKGIIFPNNNEAMYVDKSMDAALINAYNLSTDKEIRAILKTTIDKKLHLITLNTEVGGIARKESDHFLHLDGDYPGNPWILCSLWMAEMNIQNDDPSVAFDYIDWVIKHSDHTGLMPEQTNPYTGFSLGVKPLTWNHAEFIRLLRK